MLNVSVGRKQRWFEQRPLYDRLRDAGEAEASLMLLFCFTFDTISTYWVAFCTTALMKGIILFIFRPQITFTRLNPDTNDFIPHSL